jgi:hypothetical protein
MTKDTRRDDGPGASRQALRRSQRTPSQPNNQIASTAVMPEVKVGDPSWH